MKKVIAIHASRRNKNTYDILVQLKNILAKKDIEVKIISLYDLNIKDCMGCEYCITNDSCVVKDEIQELMKAFEFADGIILSSPVYLQQVSGKMKTFIDRTCKWFHRPVLTEKPILSVATTKGSGLKSTLDYLESVTVQWGAMNAGSVGRNIRNIENPVENKEVKKFIQLLNNPSSYKPSLNSLINFEVQKSLAENLIDFDVEYWVNKGWNNRPYYNDCKINPFKRFIALIIGKSIRREMNRNKIKV
jgi:multimeric flavodoxin WrbA